MYHLSSILTSLLTVIGFLIFGKVSFGIIVIALTVNLSLGLLILPISILMFYAFHRINIKNSSAWEETKNANQTFFTTFSTGIMNPGNIYLFIYYIDMLNYPMVMKF